MEKPKFTFEQVQAGLSVLHQEFMRNVAVLLAQLPEEKELTYVRSPMVLEDGSEYLVSILHIGGPKFQLDVIREAQKESESGTTES
jgi:hypothetical protein